MTTTDGSKRKKKGSRIIADCAGALRKSAREALSHISTTEAISLKFSFAKEAAFRDRRGVGRSRERIPPQGLHRCPPVDGGNRKIIRGCSRRGGGSPEDEQGQAAHGNSRTRLLAEAFLPTPKSPGSGNLPFPPRAPDRRLHRGSRNCPPGAAWAPLVMTFSLSAPTPVLATRVSAGARWTSADH